MSDWKASGIRRRDTRAAKDPEPVRAPAHRRGNRKHWCKGAVGVEHKPECRDYATTKLAPQSYYTGGKILVCATCGKELDTWWPPRAGWPLGSFGPKPDWVK